MSNLRRGFGKGILLFILIVSMTACTTSQQPVEQRTEGQQVAHNNQVTGNNGVHILSVTPDGDDAKIPIQTIEGNRYIPAQLLADVLEYKTVWDEDTMGMKLGINGPEFELQAKNKQALKADKPIAMALPPIMEKDALYIPVDSLTDLFGSDMNFQATDSEVTISPAKMRIKSIEEDDLNQMLPPASQEDIHYWENAVTSPDEPTSGMISSSEKLTAVQKNNALDFNQMEETARRYLGIKYKFGTGPFSQTGFFDCSSYMQYLFGKQGVDLPRTARAQADLGSNVRRADLAKGDMLFFYVPGRFRSDEVVGHVGLYLGNGMMIHSSPKPEDGVQLTDINKPYWKNTYIKATRISRSNKS